MSANTRNGILALCLAVAILAGIAAGVGVFGRGDGSAETVVSPRGEQYRIITSGVYRYNSERLVAEGVGWDIFTLFVAVPALLAAVPWLRRGALWARLFALGLLAYLFYQYLMYALAWAFGPLFPIFVAIYALCLVSLAWIASTVKLAKLPGEFTERFPRRGVAAFSIIMGILLIGMWLGRIIPAMRGEIQGVLLGQTTLVVQALDLGIIVPLALFTGLAVLRRQPLGYLLSSVFVVKGAAMAAAITAMLLSAWAVEGSPEVPPLVLFGAATAMAGWLGFRMYRSSRPV